MNARAMYDIGSKYAADYDSSDDAWEHAISNDEWMIATLRGMSIDERHEAADNFGAGFAAVNDISLDEPRAEVERMQALYNWRWPMPRSIRPMSADAVADASPEDDISLDELSAEVERMQALYNSIIYVALDAALKTAGHTYTARLNDTLDVDDPAQRGTPEHLALIREYETAKAQIEAWKKQLK